MRSARRFTLLILLVFCFLPTARAKAKPKHKARTKATAQLGPCTQGTAYRNCPACGSAKSLEGRNLDVLKNRDDPAKPTQEITVQKMRDPKNNTTFDPSQQVWVRAFVASVVGGGMPESCNCGQSNLRDVHINIIADPSELHDLSKYVIVEFTPRWEKKFGLDDSNYEAMRKKVATQIQGKWVKFEGWMLYDKFHENASKSIKPGQSTCPDDGQSHPNCNWRATPWEVHPVTAFTVVTGP